MIASEVTTTARPRLRAAVPTLCAAVLGGLCGLALVGQLGAAGLVVSQKGRSFQPGSLVVTRGDTVTIVNDDSDLLHHIYVDAPNFTFDSGDQEPGSRTPMTFSERGSFQVLCGIHPKMKLLVRVN